MHSPFFHGAGSISVHNHTHSKEPKSINQIVPPALCRPHPAAAPCRPCRLAAAHRGRPAEPNHVVLQEQGQVGLVVLVAVPRAGPHAAKAAGGWHGQLGRKHEGVRVAAARCGGCFRRCRWGCRRLLHKHQRLLIPLLLWLMLQRRCSCAGIAALPETGGASAPLRLLDQSVYGRLGIAPGLRLLLRSRSCFVGGGAGRRWHGSGGCLWSSGTVQLAEASAAGYACLWLGAAWLLLCSLRALSVCAVASGMPPLLRLWIRLLQRLLLRLWLWLLLKGLAAMQERQNSGHC